MNNFRAFSAKVMGEISKLSKRIDNTVRLGEVESVDSGTSTLTISGGPIGIPYVLGVNPAIGDLIVYATNAGDAVALGQTTGTTTTAPATRTGTSRTLAVDDANRTVIFSNAALVTVTIPLNSAEPFDIGTQFALHSTGAAGLTLSTTGITINGSSPNTTIAQNEIMVLEKSGTDTWSVYGGTSA